MGRKILIAADQKAKRLSYKLSLECIKPDSEFILVKSFQEILDVVEGESISLIILDQEVCDAQNHCKRSEVIRELKKKSQNIPIISIGTEREHAIKALKDGADGFIPMQ